MCIVDKPLKMLYTSDRANLILYIVLKVLTSQYANLIMLRWYYISKPKRIFKYLVVVIKEYLNITNHYSFEPWYIYAQVIKIFTISYTWAMTVILFVGKLKVE